MIAEWVWWLSGAGAIGVAIGGTLIVRHQRYVRAIRARGWAWNPRPRMVDFLGYQAPPFGLGLHREVDDHISGTSAAGRRFDSFEYAYAHAGRFADRALTLALPAPLPTAFAFSQKARAGIGLGGVELSEARTDGLTVVAEEARYAEQVHQCLSGWVSPAGGVDLSIDGDHLVLLSAARDLDELAAQVTALDQAAEALQSLAADWPRPPVFAGYAFYGHPDWSLVGRDDAALQYYPTTREGHSHQTQNLVAGLRDGIRMAAFEHTWVTTETRMVPNSQGGMNVQTYEENHEETICGFTLPYELPALSVNGGGSGERVRFESTAFNDTFTVRTRNPKWASDVIHPRTMEWLLATRPFGWWMAGRTVMFQVPAHDLRHVDAAEATLRGFLGRIPRFVWDDLGMPVPPFLVE